MAARIQLCGRMVIRYGEDRFEERLPSRQGRLLFAYLALNRRRPTTRRELMEAIWPRELPAAADGALSALLSKLRHALPDGWVIGRDELRLQLPPNVLVDVEAARAGVHRAESAVAAADWTRAWGPTRVALHTTTREPLPGHDAPWIDDLRRELEDIRLRSLDCSARVGLGLGGSELPSTKRAGRALIAANPCSETGYRYLIEALLRTDDIAGALQIYEQLRRTLREELGVAPSATSQKLHLRLLNAAGA